jgi:hypothetical protein
MKKYYTTHYKISGVFIVTILAVLAFIPMPILAQELNSDTVNILSTKVNLLESINSKTLNAIYWFIGTLGALFAGVIGLNIYSNYKINTEKYNQIKKEIEEKINSQFEEVNKRMFSSIEENKKLLISTIDSRINSKIQPLDEKLKDLEREAILVQIERHKSKKQIGEIMMLGDLLDFDIQKGWDWRIHDTLEEIKKYIEGKRLSSDVATDLQKILNKLPKDFSKQKEIIESKINI